jgi:transcriptional regulator with XRE-family HTH domain
MTIPVRFYPGIIDFLGYNPIPEPKTRGEMVQRERMSRGLMRLHLARLAGTVEKTIENLEKDVPGTTRRSLERVSKALGVKIEA